MHRFMTLLGGIALTTTMATAADTTTVTFDNGNEGWDGPQGAGGASFIDNTFGNDAPGLRTQFFDFGISFRTETNEAFLGDYTQYDSVEISVDHFTTQLDFFGQPTPRQFIVEIINFDLAPGNYPWISVWADLGVFLDQSNPGWHSVSVTIDDPSSTSLPAGWQTNIDIDNFQLPEGITFADIISGVDRVQFTTLVPGFFFASSTYDVTIDNVSIATEGGFDPCDADIDGSGDVGVTDLLDMLAAWGACPGCPEDLDGNGTVSTTDLLQLLAAWGTVCR